ncbi:MAG: hypothetical protein ABJC05_05000 [Pyrinomonadaceae bacterium]
MNRVPILNSARQAVIAVAALLLALSPAAHISCLAQSSPKGDSASFTPPSDLSPRFRIERRSVQGGAELITIFGRLDGLNPGAQTGETDSTPDTPLVSIVRDTLGDTNPENDRLRYVWMLTYTSPTLGQRMAAAVPFLYKRVGSRSQASGNPPPPLIDLAVTDQQVWNNFFWAALQNLFFDTYGVPIKASSRTYRRNLSDYRRAHVIDALAILSLYQATETAPAVFTEAELKEIQGRLILSDKLFGGIVSNARLERVVDSHATQALDERGHNWELLRQRAEAESLYFEPLGLAEGTATHAILWVSRADLEAQSGRPFDSRFLNIASPWSDKRLLKWEGYAEKRYFDSDSRRVDAGTPGAHPVEMIPLALYGLDHPKIPILLVDFRDGLNPKKREMSRRMLQDVTRDIFSLSAFGDLPYFLGRSLYDFVTGRRGIDLNQPSRLQSYAELKLLLSLNASLDSDLRKEIAHRLETVPMNPLLNDGPAEARLARDQYKALIEYTQKPDGLAARLQRDRRAEMVPLKHNRGERMLLGLANVLSFGRYVHREDETPELARRMELARRIEYHERFLRKVAASTPQVEIVWNIDDVRRSLQFLAENGAEAGGSAASAAGRIFARTEDIETRRLCLSALYKIDNKTARNELLRIYRQEQASSEVRTAIADHLRERTGDVKRAAPTEAKPALGLSGQP